MNRNTCILFISFIILLGIICTSSIPGYIIGITKIEIFICGLGLFFFLLNNGKTYDVANFVGFVMGLVILSLFQLVLYPDGILHWFRLCLLFIVIIQMSIFSINQGVNVLQCSYYIILGICFLATSTYFAVEIFKFPISPFVYESDWMSSYNSYWYIYSSRQDLAPENFGGYEIGRNGGIFSEPGLFSTFIIFALYIYFFCKEKKRKDEFAILLTSLLTTFSTTGFILTILMVAFYMNNKRIGNSFIKLLLLSLTLVVIVYAINNLLSVKQQEHAFSFAARTYDFIGGLELFLESPIWGWGYKNYDVFTTFAIKGFGDERINSNGLMSALYQLGMIGTTIYYVPLVKIKKHFNTKNRMYFLFVLVLLFAIMGEPIQYEVGGVAIFGYMIATLLSHKKVSLNF